MVYGWGSEQFPSYNTFYEMKGVDRRLVKEEYSVFEKTAGLSDKTGKFSFCPAENFSFF